VSGSLVVLGVRELPAEVGDQKSGVENPTDEVIDPFLSREGAVTALVGEDPETSPEKTLEEGIHAPKDSASGLGSDVLGSNVVVENVEGGGEIQAVAGDVAQRADVGALVTVLGDRVADVLDGEIGDLELIAVCVDEFAILLGGGRGGIARGEGGEGGGGGRVPWGIDRGDGSARGRGFRGLDGGLFS
jgi:hypothetical protein